MSTKIPVNSLCPCNSGKKYKKCCYLNKDSSLKQENVDLKISKNITFLRNFCNCSDFSMCGMRSYGGRTSKTYSFKVNGKEISLNLNLDKNTIVEYINSLDKENKTCDSCGLRNKVCSKTNCTFCLKNICTDCSNNEICVFCSQKI